MKIPLLEKIFYSKKFGKMKKEEQNSVVEDVQKLFEEDISHLGLTEQALARDKFRKDLAQKKNEIMGEPIPPEIGNFSYLQPDKTKSLGQLLKDRYNKEKMASFEQQDQPLHDASLSFVPMVPGGIGKNIVVNNVAEKTSEAASGVVDKFTPQYMKDQNPNYYEAMQMVAQFGAGGAVLNHAMPNPTLQRYSAIKESVDSGKMNLKQAEEAVKDANKIAGDDLTVALKHLEETKQPKVSDEYNKQMHIENKKADIADAHVKVFDEDVAIKQKPNHVKEELDRSVLMQSSDHPKTRRPDTTSVSNEIIPKNEAYSQNFKLIGEPKDKTRTLTDIHVEDWVKEAANLEDNNLRANLFILNNKHPELFSKPSDVYRLVLDIKNNPTHFYKNNRPDISLMSKYLEDGSLGKLGVVKDTNQVAHLSKSKRANEKNRLERINKEQLEVGSPYPTLRPSKELPEHGDGANALSPVVDDNIIPENRVNIKNDIQKTSKDIENVSSDATTLQASPNPNYHEAMQMVAQFGADDAVLNHAMQNPTLQRYSAIKESVDSGKMNLKQAEEAVKDANKIAGDDLTVALKHLEETKQPKVSDEYNKQMHIENKKADIADAHVKVFDEDVAIKQKSQELIKSGIKDPRILKAIVESPVKPNDLDMLITKTINDGKPLPPSHSGARILKKLENTIDFKIKNPDNARSVEDVFNRLKSYGASDELAGVASEAYAKGDMSIFSDWYYQKINNSIAKEAESIEKVSKDIEPIPKDIKNISDEDALLLSKDKPQRSTPEATSSYNKIISENIDNTINNTTTLQTSPTIGAGVAGGAIAGVEIDDDGNVDYNLAKGLIGAIGASATYKGASKLYDIYKTKGLSHIEGSLPPQTKGQLARQILQDKFNRVAQLQKVKAGSKEIADELDTYRAEERYSGRAHSATEKFFNEKVDPILKKMAQKDIKIEDIDSYLHARHAIERNAKMKELHKIENGSGMSDADAAAILVKFKDNKDLQDIANSIYEINRDRLKLMEKEGLENPETIRDIEALYDNYVPLQREMGDNEFYQSSGKGFSVKGSGIKAAKGSNRAVESPFLHTLLNYQDTIVRAEKNRVGKTFLKFIEEYPDDSLYTVENLRYMPQFTKDGVIKNLNPLYKEGDNILHVMVDGKVKQIEIKDEALAKALKNLNQPQMNAFVKTANKAVRTIASLNTMYNPEFVISNFERDIQSALINMPKEAKSSMFRFLKDIPGAIRGIYREERGKKLNSTYQSVFRGMKENGGTTGWLEQYEIPQMKTNLEEKIREYQGKDLPKNTFKKVLKYIDDVSTAIENAPRLIAYKHAIDAGLTPAKSANIAKNLTVNFNKKGTAGPYLNTAYMFYNASIQGSVRTLEALTKSKKAQAAVAGIASTGYALNQYNKIVNKEAYDKISQFEKDTNYIFMREDGTYLKIKLPYGYNVFKVVGDIAAEIQNGELTKSEATSRLLGALTNAFSPIGASDDLVTTAIPTLGKPFYEMKTNENFMGSKIKPEGNPYEPDKLAQSHQYFDSVNPQAKELAAELNELTGGTKYTRGYIDISPEYIEHLAKFITGGLGSFIMRTSNVVQKEIKGEKVKSYEIPFYRLFKGEAREKVETSIAYELYKEGATKVLSPYKVKKFESNIFDAIKKRDIDIKKGFKLLQKFHENQKRVKWAEKNNIQNSNDAIKHIKSAVKSGVSKSDLVGFIKEGIKKKQKGLINFDE